MSFYLTQHEVFVRQYQHARVAPVPANPLRALWLAFRVAYIARINFRRD
jgi:hypothetical protein